MAKYDLIVQGGSVVTPAGISRADLAIAGGEIKALVDPAEGVKGAATVDAAGKMILPGFVDAHAHIPGFFLSSRLDNFTTATAAAAAGGVTTVMLMPTEDPRTLNGRYFELKRQAGEAQSFIDFAVQALVGPMTDEATLRQMADLGAISFELFLAYGGNPGFIVGHDDYQLHRLMRMIADVGGIAGVTPHSGSMIARLTEIEKARANRTRDEDFDAPEEAPSSLVETFARTRPILSEALGIARACTVATATGVRTHLRALSSEQSIDLVKMFSGAARVTSEVMSHHLVFCANEVRAFGPYGIIVPPIRPEHERDRLRRAVRDGEIDLVVSDHSPVLREDKELAWRNIWRTAPGMPGLQTLLLSMLWLVDQGVLTLEDVVRTCSERPAQIFGIYPKKGALTPGSDADFIILDSARETLVDDASQLSRANYTTLKGRRVKAAIDSVFLRGKPIWQDDAVTSNPHGRFVQPINRSGGEDRRRP